MNFRSGDAESHSGPLITSKDKLMKRGFYVLVAVVAVVAVIVVAAVVLNRNEAPEKEQEQSATSMPRRAVEEQLATSSRPSSSTQSLPSGVKNAPVKTAKTVHLDPATPVGLKYREFCSALTSKTGGRIMDIAPVLIAVVAAESQKVQADVISLLSARYDRAKGENDRRQLAMLAATLAEVHRHAVSANSGLQKQQDTVVAGSRWLSVALGHIAGLEEPSDHRTYLVDRTPGLLSLHLWFLERITDQASISAVPDDTLKKLASLASVMERSSVFEANLSQYRSGIETITANATGSVLVRKLVARYVLAYNSRDTKALRDVFDISSSARKQLAKKTLQEIIPPERWTIETYDVKRIQVYGSKAEIKLSVQYRTRDGVVMNVTSSAFEARKDTNNAWKLQ